MRMRLAAALGAGFLLALGVASFPASAADAVIAAYSDGTSNTWQPNTATIKVGESVTWTNNGGNHNVCVQTPGTTGNSCTEVRSGDANTTWTSYSHQFTALGTYAFFCEVHKASMTGTITVEAGSTGTGTGTGTTPTYTQPTDTTTAPTETQPAPVATDTTAPSFTGKVKRRASRRSLTVAFSSSEDATLKASVYRRPPRGRAFSRITQASLKVKKGKNVVTLPRKPKGSLRSGSYKVKLQLVDAAGNKSPTRTLTFKLS